MAAAILMMNMQGAVMAADKDQTIFRYSDDVPFALMADPCSGLPWADLWENFRTVSPFTETKNFHQRVESVCRYLTNFLNCSNLTIPDDEAVCRTICVGYNADDMFPKAAILEIVQTDEGLEMQIGKEITINRDYYVFHQVIGDCTNINILLGGVSDKMMVALYSELNKQLAYAIDAPLELVESDSRVANEYLKVIDDIQKTPQTRDALRYFTIKDMVSMEENLIDTENLNHSSSISLGGTYTREISTLTLAEGFKWIKHSLYGA